MVLGYDCRVFRRISFVFLGIIDIDPVSGEIANEQVMILNPDLYLFPQTRQAFQPVKHLLGKKKGGSSRSGGLPPV